MRKVILNMNEDRKYKVIKSLVDHKGNKKKAAIILGCTTRTINRYIHIYTSKGKSGFIHGNKNRKPSIAYDQETKDKVIELFNTKYEGSNITHFSELLKNNEAITVHPRTLRNWLLQRHLLSPKARRSTRRKLKNALKLQETTSLDQIVSIDSPTLTELSKDEAHPRRPRCAFTGEMIQMDASEFMWFDNTKTHLHVAIDDASGMIVGAWFDTQETLNGYYKTLEMILKNHGIPYLLYTDRRTVFEYFNKKMSPNEDTFTQFSYACHQLGIEIKTTSIPQAKGRVERLNQTLQSRLPIELKLNGIQSIEEANTFIETYIKSFNKQFASQLNITKTVFETQPTDDMINLILSRLSKRVIDSGHSIRFKNKYYSLRTSMDQTVFFPRGVKVMVIETLYGQLYASVDDKVYELEEILDYEEHSRYFETKEIIASSKERVIPKLLHPWRVGYYDAYIANQKHSFQL